MGCLIKGGKSQFELSYVDDSIGRYQFNLIENSQTQLGGNEYSIAHVLATPYEFAEGSVHTPVNYWLIEDLDFIPLKIQTKLKGLGLSLQLSGIWVILIVYSITCLLYTSPSPRDATLSRMPSSA